MFVNIFVKPNYVCVSQPAMIYNEHVIVHIMKEHSHNGSISPRYHWLVGADDYSLPMFLELKRGKTDRDPQRERTGGIRISRNEL